MKLIAGVDEAGRGPLAGPVIAAAVILDPQHPIPGLADSKKIGAKRRERLAEAIKLSALGWAMGRAEVEEIDRINILQASLLAMQRAVTALDPTPEHVQVDGNRCPNLHSSVEAIVKGDSKVAAISAASILAKVQRDAEMIELDNLFPGYGFAVHKGYPTKAHLEVLRSQGPTKVHRRSFRPVKEVTHPPMEQIML